MKQMKMLHSNKKKLIKGKGMCTVERGDLEVDQTRKIRCYYLSVRARGGGEPGKGDQGRVEG